MSIEHTPSRSVDRMLRSAEVMAAMGWSRTTLWRRVRAGAFPAPVETGPNSIGWFESWVAAARAALPRRTYGAETPYEEQEANS